MDQWYYASNGQQMGPVPLETLTQWAMAGQLQPTDLIWKDGMAAWTPAGQVPGVFGAVPPVGYPPVGGYPMNYAPVVQPPQSVTGLLIGGYVCSAISIIFCPIVFGPVGIALGAMARNRGAKQPGMILIIVASVCTVVGLAFGILVQLKIRHII